MTIGDGPLPKDDRNATLQQSSLTKFGALLPVDLFLLRDERVEDKGVDLSLELKVRGAFTNVRSQVQMKGTDDLSLNKDGSVSHAIATSNLNYLLSGQCPLYILWLAQKDEFRYVWARDEARILYNINPDWMEQQTVTIRFTNVLSAASWKPIYANILKEGQLHRDTHDRLTNAASAEPVTIKIDTDTLKALDDRQAYSVIVESGLALVSAGQAKKVLELIRMLPQRQIDEARVRLVSGYASETLGDHFSARSELGKASRDRGVLHRRIYLCWIHCSSNAIIILVE